MIQAEALTKYYGGNKALDAFSFSIGKGEIVGLVGRNGAGKSTVLRILSCQILPSEGNVLVDGIPVTESPLEVRRRIGFLPEQPPLYQEMTVRDYLRFAAGLRGLAGGEGADRCAQVVHQTGLADVVGQRIGNLSRGFQQRVGIAQAIVHDPPVVLLDEPMAGLDPLQITQIRELIRELGQRHTVLFSSHILSEITNVCDRVMVIDQGALKAEGKEEALWDTYLTQQRLRLLVRGEQAAIGQALQGVAGVTVETMESAGDGAFALTLATGQEHREAIARAIVQAGLGLLEMQGESHGLEALFMHLLKREEKP